MSLPSNNASFQNGNFGGFKTKGLARVEAAFDPFIHSRGIRIVPYSGRNFARLDGAGLLGSGAKLDSNGNRLSNNYADFKDISFSDGWGDTTGGQGALMQCDDIRLAIGESLIFDWMFILTLPRHPDALHNAFAAVRFLSDDGGNLVPMHLLVQARETAYAGPLGGIYQTPWQHACIPWTDSAPFNGTVQWLVSSGHCVSSAGQSADQNIARTWPGCLLLDHIRLG